MESSMCSLVTRLWLTIFHSYCIQVYQLLPVKEDNSLQCAVAFIKLSSQSQHSHFPLMQYWKAIACSATAMDNDGF